MPGALAIVGFASLDLHGDVAANDPLATITRLHSIPVLLIHGTDDQIDVPPFSVALVASAAKAAGLPVELHWCDGGRHGSLVTQCAADWAKWTNDFLARAASAPPGS